MTRRTLLFSTTAAAFAKSWERPVFPEWKPEFIDKLITDSPWARPYTAAFELISDPQPFTATYSQIGLPGGLPLPGRRPAGGGDGGRWGTRTEIYLTIRFASALPIRQALALAECGRDGLNSRRAQQILAPVSEYVIEISGFPATAVRGGAKVLESGFMKSARLLIRGRDPVTITAAEVPEWGNHLAATLRFPRFHDLSANEGKLKLVAAAGPIRIDQSFKLAEMVYRSQLEL